MSQPVKGSFSPIAVHFPDIREEEASSPTDALVRGCATSVLNENKPRSKRERRLSSDEDGSDAKRLRSHSPTASSGDASLIDRLRETNETQELTIRELVLGNTELRARVAHLEARLAALLAVRGPQLPLGVNAGLIYPPPLGRLSVQDQLLAGSVELPGSYSQFSSDSEEESG